MTSKDDNIKSSIIRLMKYTGSIDELDRIYSEVKLESNIDFKNVALIKEFIDTIVSRLYEIQNTNNEL